MRFLVVLSIAVAALLAVAGIAAAKGTSNLPAGFPYAAEIQATIEYDGTYSYETRGYERCGVSQDGSEIIIPGTDYGTLHIQRTLRFSHITVPVATKKELGAATAHLAVKPTVTTKGRIEDDHSAMDYDYTVAVGENEECHPVSGSCHWEVTPLPSSTLETIVAQDNGFLPRSWTISVLGANATDGECPVATGPDQLSAMLEEASTLYPADLDENFPEVTISSAVGQEFHRLQRAENVNFKVDLATPSSGSADCPLTSEETETCTHGVTGTAKVRLRRLFLYESKHAYPR